MKYNLHLRTCLPPGSPQRFSILLVCIIGIAISSCRRIIDLPVASLNAKPSAAATASLSTSSTGLEKLTFSVDVFVVDKNGRLITGLQPSNFKIINTVTNLYELIDVSTSNLTSKPGGYSAMLLLDQTGSISTTDPFNLRIEASKIFLNNLGTDDYTGLTSFTSSYTSVVKVHSGFTNKTEQMKKSLDTLALNVSGGTPLYTSTIQSVTYTAQKGPTANKAVIVFTDGENNVTTNTLEDATTKAIQQKIPLFTVGLSTDVNVNVLAQMANETSGAFFYAKDAGQLISTFGTLGNLLQGQGQVYRTTWSVTRTGSKWATGQVISTTIYVTLFDGTVIEVPFWLKVK
ncbi:vWA domain-containing protein [Spirosoma sp.]|uniref:vWA domain-containing protein n=1 Tax=Spirosoma sp. TaxID=1899569 RepID=UPI002638508A|nr:vWA domain-containing protein [Spirosoma sp.]MCX6216077.1 VWA domain-containing protein [Spirosoma sp.]